MRRADSPGEMFLHERPAHFQKKVAVQSARAGRQPRESVPPNVRKADRAIGPEETKQDRVPRRDHPAPPLLRMNGWARRWRVNARLRRAPERAGEFLPARGVRKAAKPADRQTPRTYARPSGSMFRQSQPMGKGRGRVIRPDTWIPARGE